MSVKTDVLAFLSYRKVRPARSKNRIAILGAARFSAAAFLRSGSDKMFPVGGGSFLHDPQKDTIVVADVVETAQCGYFSYFFVGF